MKPASQNAHYAKQLWRAGYKSRLIKTGVVLVMIPEPTPVSPIIGAAFIAAGAKQKASRNRSLVVEDVNKTLRRTKLQIAVARQEI